MCPNSRSSLRVPDVSSLAPTCVKSRFAATSGRLDPHQHASARCWMLDPVLLIDHRRNVSKVAVAIDLTPVNKQNDLFSQRRHESENVCPMLHVESTKWRIHDYRAF